MAAVLTQEEMNQRAPYSVDGVGNTLHDTFHRLEQYKMKLFGAAGNTGKHEYSDLDYWQFYPSWAAKLRLLNETFAKLPIREITASNGRKYKVKGLTNAEKLEVSTVAVLRIVSIVASTSSQDP